MRAVLALMQILEVGFTPHRRGKYWDRLRIDLIHLSRLHKINELGSLIDKVRCVNVLNFNYDRLAELCVISLLFQEGSQHAVSINIYRHCLNYKYMSPNPPLKVVLVALADPAVEAGFRMKLEKSVRRRPLHLQPPPPLLPEIIDDPHVNGLYRALVQCDYMVMCCIFFFSANAPITIYRLILRCTLVTGERV